MSWLSGLWTNSSTQIDVSKKGYEEIVITQDQTVSLIPNFSEKYSLTKVVEVNKCKYAINAGFYDQKGEALGLFKIGDKKTSEIHPPVTLNGYVSKNGSNITITDQPPEKVDWIFQTGPILWQYEQQRNIKMTSDKLAKRSVVVRDTTRNVRFIHFYDLVYLAELPDILKKWSVDNNFLLSTAINLDGGGASGFFSPEKTLNEIEPVGAVLCVR